MTGYAPLLILAGLIALGASPLPQNGEKAAYVAPYGLKESALGPIKAPHFFGAILGQGREADQNAVIAAFAEGRQQVFDELAKVSAGFKLKGGVQAVVWRDIHTGKLRRASGAVKFNAESDRLEVLFAKLDVRAIQVQPKSPNAPTAGSRAWVGKIAEAEKKDPKVFQPGHALAGVFGGSGDFRTGNILPLHPNAKKKIDEEVFPRKFVESLVTKDFTVVVVVACQYPDAKSRIPSRIRLYWGVGKSAGGHAVENK